jgi:hypothetical protein
MVQGLGAAAVLLEPRIMDFELAVKVWTSVALGFASQYNIYLVQSIA